MAGSSETITGSPKRFFRNKGESPALAAVFDSKAKSINSNQACGGQPIRFSMQRHKKKDTEVNINYTGTFEQLGPDYLKIDTTNMKHIPMSSTLDVPGTRSTKNKDDKTNVSIISRTNGWLTVDSRTLNRK